MASKIVKLVVVVASVFVAAGTWWIAMRPGPLHEEMPAAASTRSDDAELVAPAAAA